MQDTINGPLWTAGAEFQIYFLFPLLLLPLLKRLGPWVFIVAVTLLCTQVHWISLLGPDWNWNGPPLPLSFAVGMVASLVVFSKDPKYTKVRNWNLNVFGWILTVFGIGLVALHDNFPSQVHVGRFYLEIPFILGLGFLVAEGGLIQLGLKQGTKGGEALLKFLSGPKMIGLAAFSYSLYLTHHPIVIFLSAFAAKAHLPALISVYAVSTIALIICLPLAYLVSLVVEKPFLSKRASLR